MVCSHELLILILASLSVAGCLPNQHENSDDVAEDLIKSICLSITKSQMASTTISGQEKGLTGNLIDDCWRYDPNWYNNRTGLAYCGVGFGHGALGGQGGQIYLVTDSTDEDFLHPKPGTLRYAVMQDKPLWIVFQKDMVITLKHILIVNNQKTIDGRGHNVAITGNGCILLLSVTHIIISHVQIYKCKPLGNIDIQASPLDAVWHGQLNGDGIQIYNSSDVWIDHCTFSHCADHSIKVVGSNALTISNSHFSHYNKVIFLGNDNYLSHKEMRVTIAFNRFEQGSAQQTSLDLQEGYIHLVNNYFIGREMSVIVESARSTINSHANLYSVPDANAGEFTKPVDTDEGEWSDWNCRTDGDVIEHGAFFVPAGAGSNPEHASRIEPRSATIVKQLTKSVGVIPLSLPRSSAVP